MVTPTNSATQAVPTVNRTIAGSGSVASSTSSAIVSPTTTAASSGVSTAGIIGIAAAGVVGVAVVAGIVMFFLVSLPNIYFDYSYSMTRVASLESPRR